MKILKKLLPHLTISLSLAMIVLAIVNGFNPRMGFLQGSEAQILIILTSVVSIATALIVIAEHFSDHKK